MISVLALATAGSASAAEPQSMSEARAMDDRAANAPTHDSPDLVMYKGQQISESTWTELGLACLETRSKWVCKDSVSEFDATSEAANRRKGIATASASCGTHALWLYRHKQYEGDAAGLSYFGEWWDMPASMNNAASSYRTGEGYAHLSDFSGGAGYWYPGNTGYCAYHSNINQVYPEWNDRISSRYRYG